MRIQLTEKQQMFIDSTANETLFGGAAGGGKSYAQVIDGLLYALQHSGSKQLMLRRTFPELKRSLILVAFLLFPKEVASYNASDYRWKFVNGSIIEFGYCDNDGDVRKYQSAEYDVIRFDELTHFTEWQYRYLISRVRGANTFPKCVKSSTNPGGIGHSWVKARFIDTVPPMTTYTDDNNQTRIFIPATVQENKFLMDSDPTYIDRLKQLDENTQKALLYGEWDLFEGVFFPEFKRDIHVIDYRQLDSSYKRYLTIDYGLDMLAALWLAVSPDNVCYVYRELYQSNLIISEAAQAIKNAEQETIYQRYAPPDLFNRRQETGKSAIDIFQDNGVHFTRSSNDRVDGWLSLKELMKPIQDIDGAQTARLKIMNNCTNLIRTLPSLQIDKRNPNDVASEPHELTHLPDALRGFAIMHKKPVEIKPQRNEFESFINF